MANLEFHSLVSAIVARLTDDWSLNLDHVTIQHQNLILMWYWNHYRPWHIARDLLHVNPPLSPRFPICLWCNYQINAKKAQWGAGFPPGPKAAQHISKYDATQFMRASSLADDSLTVFTNNNMPRALPRLQMLSHQANFLLILPISFTAHGGFRKMFPKLKKESLSVSLPFSPSPCPLLFLPRQASERALDWLLSSKGCAARSLGSQGQL